MSNIQNHTKQNIYYTRAYRHFAIDKKSIILYLLLFVTPCLIIYLSFYESITIIMADLATYLFSTIAPNSDIGLEKSGFKLLSGDIYTITLPGALPTLKECFINIFISILLIFICSKIKKNFKAFAIYSIMALSIHSISCLFFILWGDFFPYTLSEYSQLYMIQQLVMWSIFIILAGLITAFPSKAGINKYIAFTAIMVYSILFGCIRYIAFLFILYEGSLLYMPSLVFTFGPSFDFLYLVCIYSIFIKSLIHKYETNKNRSEWKWL